MRVKLLRKIRKRYDMIHYPNGVYIGGEFQKGPITILTDNSNEWRLKTSFLPKKAAYVSLHEHLLRWIEHDYGRFKSKKKKVTSEVLWYKK